MLFRALLALALLAPAATAAAQPVETAQDRRAREDALHERFFQSQGSHFTILFEGPQDYQLASRALEVLEAAYFRVGSALYTFPDQTITVVLYTQQQFQDMTRAPAWAAAAYDGRIRVPIRGALEQPEELDRVLSHELTHAIVQTIAPQHVPAWLHEGLAVVFEPHGIERARQELARTTRRVPFARFSSSFGRLPADDARLAYAQSGVLVQRILDLAGGPTLVSMLTDLGAGKAFKTTVEERLFMSYDTFVETLTDSR